MMHYLCRRPLTLPFTKIQNCLKTFLKIHNAHREGQPAYAEAYLTHLQWPTWGEKYLCWIPLLNTNSLKRSRPREDCELFKTLPSLPGVILETLWSLHLEIFPIYLPHCSATPQEAAGIQVTPCQFEVRIEIWIWEGAVTVSATPRAQLETGGSPFLCLHLCVVTTKTTNLSLLLFSYIRKISLKITKFSFSPAFSWKATQFQWTPCKSW